jgi:dihydrofolate reductase
MRISFVVCMSKNRVIGRKGGMPWRMPSDLKHFRAVTLGKPVIMGRKTFDSIGTPLDGRVNYVVSRQTNLTIPGAVVVATVAAALDIERTKGTLEAIIGGGGDIWRQSMALADRIYLTELDVTIDNGDTVFPELDPALWKATSRVPLATGPKDDYAADIIVFDRIA